MLIAYDCFGISSNYLLWYHIHRDATLEDLAAKFSKFFCRGS